MKRSQRQCMEKKKNGVKIVTIGGGSSYTPELVEGFIKRYDRLPIREMWLVDIEEGKEKLEIVGALAQRMWDASPYDVEVHLTLDRKEALKDANYVTTQFRVGLMEARIKDERIPFSYGLLGQETNGAGGIFKALRTIPVILEIVEDMKQLCPNAWLINFTNPSGMVTEAVMKYGKWDKVIGLCNVPLNLMINESKLMGVDKDDLIYSFAGLNHFHWHRVRDIYGNDVTDRIIDLTYTDSLDEENSVFRDKTMIHHAFKEQLDQMHLIPCGYHRFYFNFERIFNHDYAEYLDEKIGTRGEQVRRVEKALFEIYKNPNLHEKPAELTKRGGTHYSDVACETIAAIHSNSNTHIVVTTRNNGVLPDLPADVAVEVSAYIGASGARAIAFGPMEPPQRGWLQLMKNYELCVEEAAVSGDYGLLLQAFILNPCMLSGETAKRVMDELLIAHKKYLPKFKNKIEELEKQGITIKDEKARILTEKGL